MSQSIFTVFKYGESFFQKISKNEETLLRQSWGKIISFIESCEIERVVKSEFRQRICSIMELDIDIRSLEKTVGNQRFLDKEIDMIRRKIKLINIVDESALFELITSFSRLWIYETYEIFRSLDEFFAGQNHEFKKSKKTFDTIRVGLAKNQESGRYVEKMNVFPEIIFDMSHHKFGWYGIPGKKNEYYRSNLSDDLLSVYKITGISA